MDATGPPDARELAAFSELEGKLVEASRRVKTAEQNALSAIQSGRRAALTKAEIDAAPETAATWAAVGRAFVLQPRQETLSELEADAEAAAAAATRAREARAAAAKIAESAQQELQELVKGSPALAAAVARAGT